MATRLLREIGEVAQTTRAGALFLIDEMHNLDAPSLAAICIAFQAISRHGLPVAMVAAGLPDLQVRLMSAKPYADRLFSYHELSHLPDPAARAALIAPASTRGVDYQKDAARRVVREAAGYPYFIQEYGLELWNHAETSRAQWIDFWETITRGSRISACSPGQLADWTSTGPERWSAYRSWCAPRKSRCETIESLILHATRSVPQHRESRTGR